MRHKNINTHPTLIDVAREARVSVSTAARVMRSSSYPVAEELQKRVRLAAAKLGYVPNLLAKKLRGGAHPSIGLIVGNMQDPFFSAIAQNVTIAANEESLLAIVANMQRDPKLEIAMVRELWEHRVNGLILAGGGFDQISHREELGELVDQLKRSGIVVVSLSERGISAPVFSTDHERVGEMLAQVALDNGHSQIGVAAGPQNSFVTRQRLKGIARVLDKAKIRPIVIHTEFGITGGVDIARQLLKANKEITAVLANADTHGVGIVQELFRQGYRVPDDISVISAGNTYYARLCTPQLTSIDIRLNECCKAAVCYIAAAVEGKKMPRERVFEPVLMAGQSVRSVAAGTGRIPRAVDLRSAKPRASF